jgi:hypothetical protein
LQVDEDRAEKAHLLYDIANLVDVDPITDIVWVLDEQEDDTG